MERAVVQQAINERDPQLPPNAELEPGAADKIYRENHMTPSSWMEGVGRRHGVSRKRRVTEAEQDIIKAERRLLGNGNFRAALTAMSMINLPLHHAMDAMCLAYCSDAIKRCGGNQSKAAKQLGVHRNTLAGIITRGISDS